MNKIEEDFKKYCNYIILIGFIYDEGIYVCTQGDDRFVIYLYNKSYSFEINSKVIGRYDYNDLIPIQTYFKKELRTIKLKKLLLSL